MSGNQERSSAQVASETTELIQRASVAAGIAHIVNLAETIGVEEANGGFSPRAITFHDTALMDTLHTLCGQSCKDADTYRTLLDTIVEPEHVTRDLLSLSRALIDDDPAQPAVEAVLATASTAHQRAIEAADAESFDDRIEIVDDWLTVAGLYCRAGNTQGMQKTAEAAAHHLLRLEGESGTHDSPYMDMLFNKAAGYTEPTPNRLASRLTRRIQNERFKKLRVVGAQHQLAASLLTSGCVEASLAISAAFGERPFIAWDAALALTDEGENALAEAYVAAIEQKYPEHFTEMSQAIVAITDVTKVLTRLGRDDLLVSLFATERAAGQDTQLQAYAYDCGFNDQEERFQTMLNTLPGDETTEGILATVFAIGTRDGAVSDLI